MLHYPMFTLTNVFGIVVIHNGNLFGRGLFNHNLAKLAFPASLQHLTLGKLSQKLGINEICSEKIPTKNWPRNPQVSIKSIQVTWLSSWNDQKMQTDSALNSVFHGPFPSRVYVHVHMFVAPYQDVMSLVLPPKCVIFFAKYQTHPNSFCQSHFLVGGGGVSQLTWSYCTWFLIFSHWFIHLFENIDCDSPMKKYQVVRSS